MTETSVKSAARAISILGHFQDVREPQSLKLICDRLGYPQSSTTVLLKTLTQMGYLNYDRVRRLYFPTMRVTALGDWIPAVLFSQGEALEIIRDVRHATQETVVLVIRNDIYLQYLVTLQSSHPLRFHVEEGSMRLLTNSTLGWLLMASLKDKEADNLIRRCNIAAGVPASANLAEILDEVKLARERGWVYGENTPFLGGATLGVLLPSTIQGQPAVLGCGGVLERMRENQEQYLARILQIVR